MPVNPVPVSVAAPHGPHPALRGEISRALRREELFIAGAFVLLLLIVWLEELADLPHLLLGALATPVNWTEALTETAVIVPVGVLLLIQRRRLLGRLRYLEGFLPVCAHCKRIRVAGQWQPLDLYVHEHSAAQVSHSICPACSQELYGYDIYAAEHE